MKNESNIFIPLRVKCISSSFFGYFVSPLYLTFFISKRKLKKKTTSKNNSGVCRIAHSVSKVLAQFSSMGHTCWKDRAVIEQLSSDFYMQTESLIVLFCSVINTVTRKSKNSIDICYIIMFHILSITINIISFQYIKRESIMQK